MFARVLGTPLLLIFHLKNRIRWYFRKLSLFFPGLERFCRKNMAKNKAVDSCAIISLMESESLNLWSFCRFDSFN